MLFFSCTELCPCGKKTQGVLPSPFKVMTAHISILVCNLEVNLFVTLLHSWLQMICFRIAGKQLEAIKALLAPDFSGTEQHERPQLIYL